jgi:hypothetical protein
MMEYLRRSVDPPDRYRRWIDPRHGSLRLEDVLAYLARSGWKPLPPDRPGLLAFQEPSGSRVNGQPVCQFAPDSEEYDNYGILMFELITGLAEYEDRQASEVIDDILRPGHDHPVGASAKVAREAEIASR